MWQSLGLRPELQGGVYCSTSGPAGADVIGPFLDDRKEFLKTVVEPLQQKEETLYVVPGSDAQDYAKKRFPHKHIKPVGNGLRPSSIQGYLTNLPRVFSGTNPTVWQRPTTSRSPVTSQPVPP